MKNDRRRSRPLENQIREVLLRDWDPFCVGENPNLADEYDDYIGWLAEMSRPEEMLSVRKVSDALERIEVEELEVVVDCQTRLVAAQKLFLVLVAAQRRR